MLGRMLLVLGTVALLSLGVGVSRAAAVQGPSPSNQLQVWNVNTKNMGGHPGFDYTEFVAYITDPARSLYYPDIVTLQEVGRPASEWPANSCERFVERLEARTSVDYRCFETTLPGGGTLQGGAGIAYRTGRLSFQSKLAYTLIKKQGDVCKPDETVPDLWTGLVLRLKDDVNQKFVNVASLHLPVVDEDKPPVDCAWDNMKLANAKIDSLGTAKMRIMAGDWNHSDATPDKGGPFQFWECWYKGTNVNLSDCGNQNLGWKDPMYRLCSRTNTTASAIYNCLHGPAEPNHLSTPLRRIDFLFAKAYAMDLDGAVTVSWEDADVSAGENPPDGERYSDHRGQGVLLTYYP
jgi:endonuclease/exonuclease/phosphatase family metal-dependent hydrolase